MGYDKGMIQRFYQPILHNSSGLPCIIYPSKDQSRLDTIFSRDKLGCLEKHLDSVIQENAPLIEKADYLIAIIWNLEKQPLADIWMFQLESKNEAGPLVIALTFKGETWVKDMGTASGDGLIVLGAEETLRRRSLSLDVYLNIQTRQDILPDICRADEPFYLSSPIPLSIDSTKES